MKLDFEILQLTVSRMKYVHEINRWKGYLIKANDEAKFQEEIRTFFISSQNVMLRNIIRTA